MTILQIASVVKEIGLAAGAFGLCAWMVVYIVKKMAGAVDALVAKMEVFTVSVATEHKQHTKEHEAIMRQHEGITESLGRINGFKP